MDQIDALRLFIRVAETGSFSRAASEFGMGQPAASRAISGLEAHYGARLLHRTTRRISLTEAGALALEQARHVLDAADQMDAVLRGADRAPVGLLRISASIAFSRAELAPHLPGFLAQHPFVRVDLVGRDDRVDLVSEGIDLALRLGPLEDSSLRQRLLGYYRRIMVASPGLLARAGVPEAPDDLKRMPALVFTTTPYAAQWPLERGPQRRTIEISGPVRCSNGELIRDFAEAGLGVALAPDFLWRHSLESGRVVQVLPEWEGPRLPLHALWSARDLTRKARAFLDHMSPSFTCTQ